MGLVILILALNWFIPLALITIYCLWLRFVSHDVVFCGFRWIGILPVAVWRLVSSQSWYAKMWRDWYGVGLMNHIIYRNEIDVIDDRCVESTIKHELRHCLQGWILGALMYPLYVLDCIFIYFFVPLRHPYEDNWFERDARKYAGQQVDLTADQWINGPGDRWPFWHNPTDRELRERVQRWRARHG